MNSRWFAQASLIASLTRRTLTLTTAPIFSSLSRIVFAQARASAVFFRPIRRMHEHVGGRGEPQTQLIGPERGGRESIGKEIQLRLFDAVLALPAGAVKILIQRACPPRLHRQ
jgi:hypothetical protein